MNSFNIINLKKHFKKTLHFCVLCLILYTTMSCNSSQNIISSKGENQEWKIVKVSKNAEASWTISSRKIGGTNFFEYKIEGDIPSSPKACISSFRQDIYNLANGSKKKKYPTYKIVDESKESLLTYVIHKEPFPFKNTEMSIRYDFFQDPENTIEEVTWREAWEEDSVPAPSRKLSRVQSFRGSWYFSEISNNHTKAINTVQFDPKSMPQWIIRPMVVKFLRQGLENIREMTSK